MNISDYAKRVKTFKKSDIISAIQTTQVGLRDLADNMAKIKTAVDSAVSISESWFVTKSIASKARKAGVIPSSYTLFDLIEHDINAGLLVLGHVEKSLSKYGNVWDGSLLTLRQANILNVVEYLGFWVDYTNGLFDIIVSVNNGKDKNPERYVTRDFYKWLNGTSNFYADFSIQLGQGANDFNKRLDSIPDTEVDEVTLAVLEETTGIRDMSAVTASQNFGIHSINPIFWVGVVWSKVQLARIERMRATNEMLAMKINQAVNRKSGVNDPALDKQIEVYQDKIIKLTGKIRDIEAAYE